MATIRKRGSKWEAGVYVNGKRRSASFDTKSRATAWAVSIESELRAVGAGTIPMDKTFGDLLRRYSEEVSPTKKGEKFEITKINAMFKREDPLLNVRLCQIGSPDVSAWRDRRLAEISPDGVLREWTLLSHACTVGKKDWGWLADNPFKDARRPKAGSARSRRLEAGEIERILLALGTEPSRVPTTVTARVGFVFLFALETAMRSGEICNLTWADVGERTVTITESKNGDPRVVPLSSEARRLLSLLPRGEPTDPVFQVNDAQRDAIFRKALTRAMLDDLHFHDTRREALTRLSQKVDVMTLAKISGHRDLRILQNTYYAPRMEDVAARLD